jgi:hypothetical protein
MSDEIIQKALAQIAEHEAAASRFKRFVNDYDTLSGREPRFANVGDGSTFTLEGGVKPKGRQFSPGQFFNKPFAGAVKLILQGRYEANGNNPSPASVDEIHEALTQGSFAFETMGADAQKNSIKISLGKNSSTFVKLPNTELFGLTEWYGGRRGKPGRKSTAASAVNAADDFTIDPADLEQSGDEQENTEIEATPAANHWRRF